MLQKNFTYGDLWPVKARQATDKHGKFQIEPSKVTTNSSFIKYIEENNFTLYIDYDTQHAAVTYPNEREIVLNGNYSPEMFPSLLQHELGHLMIFDVAQFTSIRADTFRSIIAKVLYTPQNFIDYGFEQLLYVENVIQDIIIETFSNDNCVCINALNYEGYNMAVKHLDTLESIKEISKETAKNLLEKTDESLEDQELPEELSDLLESMLKDLNADIEEIKKHIEKTKENKAYQYEQQYKRIKEWSELKNRINKLERKQERNGSTPKLDKMLDNLRDKLKENESEQRKQDDYDKGEQNRQREIDRSQKKLEKAEELKEILEKGKENCTGESESEQSGSGEQQPNQGDSNCTEDCGELHENYTDHLGDDSNENSSVGHSCDCGFPNPITVTRDESYVNEQSVVNLESKPKVKKIEVQEDLADNLISNRIKTPENELTFFKSNKKEFDETDMLKGKRKIRVSGINVLIGLDVSGSMSNEWTNKFKELSDMAEQFKDTLDIENIVYFTYNQNLQEASSELEDLKLKARGGNAFGYVYQQILQKLPIMQKNEIILVTDCGDNLGFPLNDVCEAERNGSTVQNHITIVDTENAGFYNKQDFNEDDWSLYRYDDPRLQDAIRESIENLTDQ